MKLLLATGLCVWLTAAALSQTPDADKRQLAACARDYQAAKTALAKHPKDPTVRAKFVRAGDRYATAAMTSNALTPHVRYPLSLRLYREVLKVDPHNREASANSAMIEQVYRSMHRPIPK